MMRIIILDAYVDEPSCLGVPPYISPYVRYLAGAVSDSGFDYTYITIDELMDILKYSEMSRRDIRFVMERWNRFKKDGIRIKSKSSIYFCCNSDYHLGCSV